MLTPKVLKQQAMLGAVPAPGNSGEILMGQVVKWGLPEEDQRRIGKILDKTLYERGEGRGPLTKVRTQPGDVRRGYSQTAFSAEAGGGSYLGLHNSVATVTYLHKMLIEDPDNFDSVLRDLEKDLELTDIQISEETGNNIVAFSEYNENSGEYIFYHKNGKDGKLVLNSTSTDREAGILDPKALLKLVVDGGVRHFEGLSSNVIAGGTGEVLTAPGQTVHYTFHREDNYVQNNNYKSLGDFGKIVPEEPKSGFGLTRSDKSRTTRNVMLDLLDLDQFTDPDYTPSNPNKKYNPVKHAQDLVSVMEGLRKAKNMGLDLLDLDKYTDDDYTPTHPNRK